MIPPAGRPRGAQERRVVRHKSYSLSRQTPWAAVFELEAMDYDFHLFTDSGTGCDSVVHRAPESGGYGLLCSVLINVCRNHDTTLLG